MKPSSWQHMLMWGAGSGFIFGGVFMIILNILENANQITTGIPVNPLTTGIGLYAGLMVGMVSGAITGIVIEQLLPLPLFPVDKTRQSRLSLWLSIVALLINVSLSLSFVHYALLYSGITQSETPLLTHPLWISPTLFSAVVMVYATIRYIHRLRVFGEQGQTGEDSYWKEKRYPIAKPKIGLDDLVSGVHKDKRK